MSEITMSAGNSKPLLSLDFFRGFTMFILIGSGLYEIMRESDHWVSFNVVSLLLALQAQNPDQSIK
ncbi:MAG: hypothetical protein OEY51_04875 [Cyclobacteriaceae bacterium]|nr:hypothetical protein [Cyclobacteriaceae bacterium]